MKNHRIRDGWLAKQGKARRGEGKRRKMPAICALISKTSPPQTRRAVGRTHRGASDKSRGPTWVSTYLPRYLPTLPTC